MGFMRDQFYKAKNDKFKLLFNTHPGLNPGIICAFHPVEGCLDCDYTHKCELKIGGDLL